MAVYSSGSQLEWKRVFSGGLPSPRFRLRATSVGNVLFVTGGFDGDTFLTSILSWDPVAERWQGDGDLDVRRNYHAAVAIPASTIAIYCKN